MSGLYGYCSPDGARWTAIIEQMGHGLCGSSSVTVTGRPVNRDLAIGRVTLGVFNTRHQPVTYSDGRVSLWMTGEFYHQQTTRHALGRNGEGAATDEELALATYLSGGPDAISRLPGAFVIAIWDEARAELSIVNDRFALYPHYFVRPVGGFAFAPELAALMRVPGVHARPDMTAVAQYMRFQQVLGDRTWVEGVSALPPAVILRYRPADDRFTVRRYWDWDRFAPHRATLAEAAEEAGRLFQRAVDAMTEPPLRAGLFLSGGLDGRMILAFTRPTTPLATLTFGAADCRDVAIGGRLAVAAGRPHSFVPFDDGRWVAAVQGEHLALTDGFHSCIHAHGMTAGVAAREVMDVNLSGWDGATILGQYFADPDPRRDGWYRNAPSDAVMGQRLYDAFCGVVTWPGLTDAEAAMVIAGPWKARLNELARASFLDEFSLGASSARDRRALIFYTRQHVRRSTGSMIVFQRSSVEVRCPYFDYDFLSFMFSLPADVASDPQLRRLMLGRRAPRLARIPNERDMRLPHPSKLVRGVYDLRRKAGRVTRRLSDGLESRPRLYADYERYLRTDLREWAEGILFDSRTADRGLFDQSAMRGLWNRHLRGAELWTVGKIAPFITLELMMRRLFDGAAESGVFDPMSDRRNGRTGAGCAS